MKQIDQILLDNSVWYRHETDLLSVVENNIFYSECDGLNFEAEITNNLDFVEFMKLQGWQIIGEL